jgi:hypothetical protein
MAPDNLRDKLINKIKETDDRSLLEEISNLLELQEPDTIYTTNDKQKGAIKQAKEQIANNQFLSHHQANKDIDEWQNK